MKKQDYLDMLLALSDIDIQEITVQDGIATGYRTYAFRKTLYSILKEVQDVFKSKKKYLKNIRTENYVVYADLVRPYKNIQRVSIAISKDN